MYQKEIFKCLGCFSNSGFFKHVFVIPEILYISLPGHKVIASVTEFRIIQCNIKELVFDTQFIIKVIHTVDQIFFAKAFKKCLRICIKPVRQLIAGCKDLDLLKICLSVCNRLYIEFKIRVINYISARGETDAALKTLNSKSG